MTDRTDYDFDPSDRFDTPGLYERDDERESNGYYDADDGYAHLDELRPFDDTCPF